jgi:multidrug efflux pump subunit AcrA (membrane-fusion protein)
MKSLLRVGAVLVVIGALVGGGFWLYRSRAAAQSTTAAASGQFTQVVAAQRGNLSSSLTVVGDLDAVQRADLSFEKMKGTAELLTLDVAAGNTVKAGQVLATIDAASYQQALDQARSDLQAAEEKLADLQAPADAQDIAEADV